MRDSEIEYLYQKFKKRLIEELMVDVPNTSHYGCLLERGTCEFQEKEPSYEDK
jgi:hypothetical protein